MIFVDVKKSRATEDATSSDDAEDDGDDDEDESDVEPSEKQSKILLPKKSLVTLKMVHQWTKKIQVCIVMISKVFVFILIKYICFCAHPPFYG